MFLHKRNIWFILINLALFCYWATFWWTSVQQIYKYKQSFFNAVFSTPMNIRWFNFPFQPNFNVEATLVHRRWINVILSTLFQRCFANVETKSINVRRPNFHFQPNINVDECWRSTLFQRWFNVDVFAGYT